MNTFPFVSIIIPAYNEEKNIVTCIQSIKTGNYPSECYEIIVVDNGSQDETVRMSKTSTSNVYVCPGKNISSLRNFGTKKAKGNIFAFIDADCVADKDWIFNAVKLLATENCVTGSEVQIPDEANWIERTWFTQKDTGKYETTHINSANLIVRRDLFQKLDGFNENIITGEDYEFCMRAEKYVKIISDDSIKVVHLGNPKNVVQFLKREIWHGLGAFSSLKLNWIDKPLIGTVLFFLLSTAQLIGVVNIVVNKNASLFLVAAISMFLLLWSTVMYRKHDKILSHYALKLMSLYYFYYLGRTISLIYILMRKKTNRFRTQ